MDRSIQKLTFILAVLGVGLVVTAVIVTAIPRHHLPPVVALVTFVTGIMVGRWSRS